MSVSVKGYSLQQSQYVKEIDGKADIYIHEGTKAKLLVIENDDTHKSFCVGFRTPPNDSTGVAHIIEHSVLCGSEKYPLKDPFVELAKGSLNTYLNAMTYPDKTLYPISSQNDKDFHNLMDVYLDAVFFPNIYKNKEILMQEGWRYHLESKDEEITYKGVVYNEMKGAFSSPEEIGFRLIKETLFPDNTYSNESGGAPADIPDLTYEKFLEFHKKYYHPSNSYICLYGKIDVNETLTYIDREYLSKFKYQEIDSEVETQAPFKETITQKEYYSATPDKEDGLFLSYNFVVGNIEDRKLMLAMSLLEYVLLDTPASVLKKALIKEGIGDEVYGAFQTHLKQPIFSIVAKNVKSNKKERFYELVNQVLSDTVKNGIPKNLLRGALQVKEFELREGDASGYSKGLFYALAAMKIWIYDESPLTYLKYDEEIQQLKKEIDTDYFEQLIKTFILGNSHAAKVELYPKVGLEKELEDKVNKKLDEYKKSLSDEELEELIKETQSFNRFQEDVDSEEAKKCIPLLEKSDLRREVKYPIYEVKNIEETEYIVTPVFTNKISYITWHVDLTNLQEEYIPYIGLISSMLGKIDTEKYNYEDLTTYIDEHIGGISYSVQTLNGQGSKEDYLPLFQIQSKALVEKVSHQVSIMREVLMNTKFDDADRLLEIIREIKSMMESIMSSEGHRVSYSRLLSHLTRAESFDEKTKGICFYEFISKIEKEWESAKYDTIDKLKKTYGYLSNKSNIKVGLVADEEEINKLTSEIQKEISKIPSIKNTPHKDDFQVTEIKEALIYPSNVNYVAMGYNFKEAGHEYHGGMMMLKTVLSMGYLWSKVRVQNGAYGCFCDFRRSGNVFFVSYRDPNIKETLDAYREVADYVETISLSDRELLQYLIGTISQMDFPFTPSSEGRAAQTYHMMNVKKEDLQKNRDQLFQTNNETLSKFAKIIRECTSKEYYCIFGNQQNIDSSKVEFNKKTII